MSNLKKIGIIGGGQLGKMMILDAKRYGFYVVTLDPTLECPSHAISDEHIVAPFDDEVALRSLAEKVDVITYEFEHIGVHILKQLSAEGYKIYPTPSSLEIIQDKFTQKTALLEAGIPIPDFKKVMTIEDIKAYGQHQGYPVMLKTCTGGYDGKGNALIKEASNIEEGFHQLGSGKIPLMVEAFVPFEKEISVLACRGVNGEVVIYPVGENGHVNSILDITMVPANISEACTNEAKKLAEEVMTIFHGVGMFCVELFVTEDESLYVNEVAPRPHNSGHYTIEGCLTSQFENHIRAITELPLGQVELRSPVVMRNLLGAPEAQGPTYIEGLEKACSIPQVKIHLYGKEEVKPYRKMGHLTAVGATTIEAKLNADRSYGMLKITSKA